MARQEKIGVYCMIQTLALLTFFQGGSGYARMDYTMEYVEDMLGLQLGVMIFLAWRSMLDSSTLSKCLMLDTCVCCLQLPCCFLQPLPFHCHFISNVLIALQRFGTLKAEVPDCSNPHEAARPLHELGG
jgi:hypothetical protein